MADYIEREAAIARVKKQMDREPTFGPWAENDRIAKVCYGIVIEALERLPSADVKPVVHGRWVKSNIEGSMLAKCSLCGFDLGAYSHNYCPHCGATMDMRGNDNERE